MDQSKILRAALLLRYHISTDHRCAIVADVRPAPSALVKIEHLADRLDYLLHEGSRQTSQRPLDQAPIIDRPQLIDQQVGAVPQTP